MEALLKSGPERGLDYHNDFPEPKAGDGEVLVDIRSAAVCGTDIHFYEWDEGARNFPLEFPRVLGHEAAGIVRSVGRGATGVAVGDRVAFETHIPCGDCFACKTGNQHNCERLAILGIDCDGAFASTVAAPTSILYQLPPQLGFDVGALLEPAGVAMHALQRSEISPGDTVAVVGCGPIGLMACRLAKIGGAAQVFAVDINPTRLEFARSLGATVFNPKEGEVLPEIMAMTRARGGVDVAIETSGARATYDWFLDSVRREGTVVTVGHPGGKVEIDVARSINKRGLTIRGVFGRRMWSTWNAVISLIEGGQLDLDEFITHRFTLPEYRDAFAAVHQDAIKIMLSPDS